MNIKTVFILVAIAVFLLLLTDSGEASGFSVFVMMWLPIIVAVGVVLYLVDRKRSRKTKPDSPRSGSNKTDRSQR